MTKRIDLLGKLLIFTILFTTPLTFNQQTTDGYSFIKFDLILILSSFLGLTLVLKLLFWKDNKVSNSQSYSSFLEKYLGLLGIPLILFIIWQAITLLWAPAFHLGFRFLLSQLALLIFFIIFLAWADNSSFLKKAIIIAAFATLIISLYGILQFFGLDPWGPQYDTYMRQMYCSTLGHSNFGAEFLLFGLPLTAFLLLNANSRKSALFWASLIIFAFFYFLLTFCRSAWLGFALAIILVLYAYLFTHRSNLKLFYDKIKPFWFLLVIIFLIFAIASGTIHTEEGRTIWQQIGSITDLSDKPILFRLSMWQTILKMIPDHPLMGFGIYNFPVIYTIHRTSEERQIAGLGFSANHAHNDFLQITVETGLVGLGLFLLIWSSFFILVRKLIIYSSKKGISSIKGRLFFRLGLALLAAGTGIFIQALFSFPFYNPATALYFVFLLGLTDRAFFIKYPKSVKTQPKNLKSYPNKYLTKLLLFLFLLGFLVLLTYAIILLLANRELKYAMSQSYYELWSATEKVCQRSLKLDPYNYETTFLCGEARLKQNNFDGAIEMLQRTLQLYPNHLSSHYDLGICYGFKGWHKQAVKELEWAVEKNLESSSFHNALGAAYANLGELEKAVACYEVAIKIKPNDAKIFSNLGSAYARLEQFEKAENAFEKALELDPELTIAIQSLEIIRNMKSNSTIEQK